MSKTKEGANALFVLREAPDLRQQYRPIGIGAVAAALSVTAKERGAKEKAVHDESIRPDNWNEGFRFAGSMAA
jgi:hypothetical protein